MDDRVIKGNGKSNLIKFDLTGITSFADFVAANNAGTLKCDVVANNDGSGTEVIGTPLSKATLFDGEMTVRYGTDTPSKGFNFLIREWAVTVSANGWSANPNSAGYYTNTVTATGMKEVYTPIFVLNETSSTLIDDAISAFAELKRMTTADNSVTFLALDKPDVDIPVRIKGV